MVRGDVMTAADEARLEALIKGAFAADEGANVAVAVRDLRWLLCLVDTLRQPAEPILNDNLEANEGNHERESE
jgi:hypothetical protein